MERQSFTCSNPKCANVFTNPLIVENMSYKDKASYCACPNCLTEIATERGLGAEELKQPMIDLEKAKPELQTPEIHKCSYNFGYMSQHLKDENIPEDCFTCRQLLACACTNTPPQKSETHTPRTRKSIGSSLLGHLNIHVKPHSKR